MLPVVPDLCPTPLPANIGRFRVDAVLGRGGMGEVYKAFDPTLQRTVAVKTVRPDISRPDLFRRLLREAQACARLRHPNVVTVYEAGELGDVVYIVMEYLRGEDVGTLLQRGSLTFEDKIRILVQVLDGLQHAHDEGVIHRDIKPSNVQREPDGCVKVVDFGVARMSQASPLTRSDGVLCTLDYASPQQLRGEPLDKRTDVYSTGALAYELFTGRPPFKGDNESVGALVLRVVSEPAPPMDVSWSRTFPEIERIVTRAMAKSPADRYQSAEDMRNALTAFFATSREAIVAAQAEFDADAQRAQIAATTLVAAGKPGDAEGLTIESLRLNPDVDATCGTRPDPLVGHAQQRACAVPETRDAANAGGAGRGAAATPVLVAPRPDLVGPATGVARDVGSVQPLSHVPIAMPAPAPASRRWWWMGSVAAAIVVVAAMAMLPWPPPPSSPGPLAGQTRAPGAPGSDQVPIAAAQSSGASRPETGVPPSAAPPSAAPPSAVPTSAVPTSAVPTSAVPDVPPYKTPPAPAALASALTVSEPTVSGQDVSAKQLFAARPDSPTGVVNAGLRYRLTRRSADGVEADVDPTTTSFRSGDRIRFTFESNIDGYLYVVQQGSSGAWTVLFPGPDINGGRNAVGRAERYEVPSNDWFRFDDTPGTEQIFVLLSRQPMLRLPGFDRPVTRIESVVASVVADLQKQIASRDLVFEKDARKRTETGAAVQATYVVNRTQLGQAVAASLSLIHTR